MKITFFFILNSLIIGSISDRVACLENTHFYDMVIQPELQFSPLQNYAQYLATNSLIIFLAGN